MWKGTIHNGKQDLEPVKINKLFQNKFFYEKKNKTYFDYLKTSAKEGENCMNNFKKCGILDSNNNILCLPNNEECPLNDFKISDIELTDYLSEYNHIELTESITGIKKYIYFTNNKIDNNIIAKFELSYDNPCISPFEHSWISANNKEKEKSSNCFTHINNKLYNSLYSEVGNNILIKSLYYDNGIKIFNDFSSEKVKLYTRNFYYINEECSNNFIKIYEASEFLRYDKKLIIAIYEFFNIIIIIFNYVLFAYTLNHRNKLKNSLIALNAFGMYLIISNIIIFLFLYNEKQMNFKCGGDVINERIQYIINEKYKLLTKIKMLIYFCIAISATELLFLNAVFYLIKKNKFKLLRTKSDII